MQNAEGKRDLSFTVRKEDAQTAYELLKSHLAAIGAAEVSMDEEIAKVSIVGGGMNSHHGVAMRMFGALSNIGVNIRMISTSEIKISVIIDKNDADRAVAAVHEEFIG